MTCCRLSLPGFRSGGPNERQSRVPDVWDPPLDVLGIDRGRPVSSTCGSPGRRSRSGTARRVAVGSSSPASGSRGRGPCTTSVEEGGGNHRIAHHAREHPRLRYEQPHRGHARSLDSGHSRRNPVLRPPGSANISLTARRAPAGPAAPLTDTMPAPTAGIKCRALDNRPPYQRRLPRGASQRTG